MGKVDRWTTSDQKQRWLATTLLEIEPRLRRLRGYRALPQLRVALQQGLTQGKEVTARNERWGCSRISTRNGTPALFCFSEGETIP